MAIQKLKSGVFSVGAKHWDRRLFDELIPLPEGTTYNAYLIRGSEKTALIDTVDPEKKNDLLENLESLKVKNIDYVIANHAEQDHSGAIPEILEKYPKAIVVTNEKCKKMLIDLLQIPEDKFLIVKDQETLSLGDKTLQFILTPWVHWPETMVTYLREDRILFPCDFFGAHFASSELFVKNEVKVYESAKRYYAEIMMPFRKKIIGNLEKLEDIEIDMIAPSHGQVYDKPELILDAYKDWTSDNVKNEVVIPYVSMHGSTQKIVEYLIDSLTEKNIVVKPFNLTVTDIGELAIALVDAATIVIGSPIVLTGPHPSAVYAAYLANALRPKARFATIIGSYGWGGKMVDQIVGMLGNLKVELLSPVLIKGYPKDADYQSLDKLADEILLKHESLKLLGD
ncbi:MAG: FprA family A-type flavoprotein [Candidatus Marinimicrobia bacterium]|nr:FprA family A-type flavoprotein [Candidatus Neomarinimicrobiota bacterium]